MEINKQWALIFVVSRPIVRVFTCCFDNLSTAHINQWQLFFTKIITNDKHAQPGLPDSDSLAAP